jgi:hypothetical protein
MSDEWMDDYAKWQKWPYERQYGKGSWDKDHSINSIGMQRVSAGFTQYELELRKYWSCAVMG